MSATYTQLEASTVTALTRLKSSPTAGPVIGSSSYPPDVSNFETVSSSWSTTHMKPSRMASSDAVAMLARGIVSVEPSVAPGVKRMTYVS